MGIQFRRSVGSVRLGKTSNRLPFPLAARRVSHSLKQTMTRVFRVMAPTLVALAFAGVAHAQGTMDSSGTQTLMGTFKTFAIYAGAVICFGGAPPPPLLPLHPALERTGRQSRPCSSKEPIRRVRNKVIPAVGSHSGMRKQFRNGHQLESDSRSRGSRAGGELPTAAHRPIRAVCAAHGWSVAHIRRT